MLRLEEVGNVFAAIAYLMHASGDLKARLVGVPETAKIEVQPHSMLELAMAAARISNAAIACEMNVPSEGIKSFANAVQKGNSQNPEKISYTARDLTVILREIEYIVRSFRDEMNSRHVFIMNKSLLDYYDPQSPLFGPSVDKAFPSASEDIAEAGKCRATGRWTACVIHLMRALEQPLQSLQRKIEVPVPKEQWAQIIDQIESKIRELRKDSQTSADLQWYSECATHFRFIKNAWRNYAAHGKERYDEERAIEIWNSTKALMRQLSTRLTE